MTSAQNMQLLLYIGLGTIAVLALFSIGIVLFGKFGEFQLKVVMSTLSIGFYSLTTAATFGDDPKYAMLGAIGIGLGVIGLLAALSITWSYDHGSTGMWRSALILAVIAFSFAHAVTNHRLALVAGPSFVTMVASLVVIGIVALMLVQLILGDRWKGDWKFRTLLALAISDVALTIANPIVAHLPA